MHHVRALRIPHKHVRLLRARRTLSLKTSKHVRDALGFGVGHEGGWVVYRVACYAWDEVLCCFEDWIAYYDSVVWVWGFGCAAGWGVC